MASPPNQLSTLTFPSLVPTVQMLTVPCLNPLGKHHPCMAGTYDFGPMAFSCRPVLGHKAWRQPLANDTWHLDDYTPTPWHIRRDTLRSLQAPSRTEPHVSTALTCPLSSSHRLPFLPCLTLYLFIFLIYFLYFKVLNINIHQLDIYICIP